MVTLGIHVVFRVELDSVDLERKCGMDIITQWIGEVCHAQALCNIVLIREQTQRMNKPLRG